MLILNADEVRRAVPMGECIAAMKQAYAALSSGKVEMPLRTRLPVKRQEGLSIVMPAFVDDDRAEALAVKVVSVFSRNPARGLPLIHAAVLVLNPETGEVEALIEGSALTAIRTGAGCGAATDVLARKDAQRAAIFGAGVQARTQLQAICEVRQIETVWIYAPNMQQVKQLVTQMAGCGKIPKDLRVAKDSKEAIQQADIVSAATTSVDPVFEDADLQPGSHVNGAGSYTAKMQEIPGQTVARARVTVDSRSAAQIESGDIAIPLQKEKISEADIAEIGEVILGKASGRRSAEEITFFKSVGVAVQDALAGQLALTNARKMRLGVEVNW
ncbi:MAG TPA: hypothetical protein VJ019_07340 [Aestuariivirga sp.]|nr:hypothetical protein [Aestuariivirga sp.]